jgi:peptidoglycan/LPS O-acetylase OafA/YrhL
VQSKRAFFPLFDSLRGIAALSVVFFHLTNYAGKNHTLRPYLGRLDVGVTIFFLISGFLLYRPFVAARLGRGKRIATGAYAWRRLLRIVPGYWLALTLSALWLGQSNVFGSDGLLYYGFGQIYNSHTALRGIAQAWSLNVEITFYALLPLWALLLVWLPARNARGKLRNELLALLVMFGVSVAYKVVLFASNSPLSSAVWHFALPRDLDLFALGMLLAVVSVWYERRPSPGWLRALERFPVIGLVISGVAFWYVSTQIGLRGTLFERFTDGQAMAAHYLYAAVAFGLLLPAVFGTAGEGTVRRLLGNRLLLWVGVVSYGLYLWHLTILQKLDRGSFVSNFASTLGLPSWLAWAILGVGGSLIAAAASYYLFERYALRLKTVPERYKSDESDWGRWPVVAAIFGCSALLVAAGLFGTGYTTVNVALVLSAAGVALLTWAPVRRTVARLVAPRPYLAIVAGFALCFALVRLIMGPAPPAHATPQPRLAQQNAYVVATYGRGGVRLYVNGHLVTRTGSQWPPERTHSPLEIGSLAGGGAWIGTIDDAAIYDQQLDPEIVRQHFLAGLRHDNYAGVVEQTPGLVRFLPLGYGSGVKRVVPGITDKSDGAALADGKHTVATVRSAAIDKLQSFSVEAWVTVQREGNRHVFGKPGAFFVKTDYLGHWSAGYFSSHGLVTAVSREFALNTGDQRRSAPPKRESTTDGLVLGLLGGLGFVALALVLWWPRLPRPPDSLGLGLRRKRTAA